MTEFENRLRAGLATLADETPPSTEPRTELSRRLAGRSPRGRVAGLAAAAAAAVVVGVLAPAMFGSDPAPTGLTPASAVPTTEHLGRIADPDHPYRIASHGAGDAYRELAVEPNDEGEVCFLLLGLHRQPIDGARTCESLPVWGQDAVVVSRTLADLDLPMPPGLRDEVTDELVFLTSPEVARLEVRRADGTGVSVLHRQYATWHFMFAEFGGPVDGFGYTAYDSDGAVLDQAIT